jgi:hypothetical protein
VFPPSLLNAPIKRHLVKRKKHLIKRQMIYKPPSTEKHMFPDKLPSPLSAPSPRFLPVLVFVFSLLYHAPIRIKVVREGSPAGEKEQGPGDLGGLSRSCPARSSRRPLSRKTGPRKTSVPGRVQKRSTFMVEYQHRVAHGVVSKDKGLGSMSGVERLTNQLAWLFQQKPWFPVPAQTDYRNILASSNST